MSKHISFFICSLGSGGAEHQLSMLANFLTQRGHVIRIITFAAEPDHYFLDSKIERIRIIGKNRISTFARVFSYLISLKTDCFISFGQRENLISLFPFLFKKTRFIAGERNFTVGKPTLTERLLVELFYRRADYVVPNSMSQGSYLSNCKKYLSRKIKVICNYTDLDTFNVDDAPENEVIKIGVFCRFEPQKNILRFEEAIAKVKASCNIPFIVEWYGNHTSINPKIQSYFNTFKEKIIQDKLQHVLIINDPVKRVQDYLPLYDAIALPSLHEGFSNSISEAICCGKPMLVGNVSDNSFMVHDGENGFLFDPYKVDDIANAIYRFLLLNKEDRIKFGKESRHIAESLFDKDNFINNYESLLS